MFANNKIFMDIKNIPHSLAIVGTNENNNLQFAKTQAKKLLCLRDTTGCDCGPCTRVDNDQSESVLIIKPQKQIIKIDQTKKISEFVRLSPINKANIVIIQNANLMNKESANYLLKMLEEPSKYQYFFLLAPSEGTLIPTIVDRLQIFRVSSKDTEVVEDKVIFKKAESLLDAILQHDLNKIFELDLKGKTENLLILERLRKILRDLAMNENHLAKKYSSVELEKINKLFDLSTKMTKLLNSNVDSALVFEHMVLTY